jgi:hypothetical protein
MRGLNRNILRISNLNDEDTPKENFLSNYGELTLEQVVVLE